MIRPRVLLADDHRMMAEGLKALLHEEFELVGIVEDGRAMIEAAEKLLPDVIVADVTMPNLNGFEALAHLRKTFPNIKVIFLTMHQNAAYARRALDAGASGFVVKHSASEELVVAIHAALKGQYLHHSFLDEKGRRAGRERRSRREGRRECAYVAAERDSAIARGGTLCEGDRGRTHNFGPNRRIPQVSNDGNERASQQCRTDSLRDQTWNHCDLICHCRSNACTPQSMTP